MDTDKSKENREKALDILRKIKEQQALLKEQRSSLNAKLEKMMAKKKELDLKIEELEAQIKTVLTSEAYFGHIPNK
jgi:peptidoglycan hydrolase CwlO-like protein